ncbi:DHH family phosphoesterase [Sinanaerobacter chloroacetimidivorans]|uniref:DHH family phosphoesterase n=1 Tax=Sinanaerobacter chloroacetimidivorans TaxID=2818044 RepID=A0A8J7W3N7_9FIRM|nr:DHH family phosphoesterase [Sinanaerobacter chloroacetimidivorans]MBR0598340.1 DHH family phosphoesterase [Sinanaerobacter chloroacetimidivorans]
MGEKTLKSRIESYFNIGVNKKKESMRAYTEHIVKAVDKTMSYSVANHPLPLCLIDSDGMFLWFNKKFSDIYQDAEAANAGIYKITGLKPSDFFTEDLEKPIVVSHNGKTYRVVSSFVDEDKANNAVLYWIDITNYELLKSLYKDEKNCFAYVSVDNYDELIASSPDERKSIIAAEIERTIRQWATKISASVTRFRSYQYFIVFEYKHFEKLEAGKFSILDEVREIETDADFPASLSIGIGVGGKTPQQMDEYATAALDLALGRGGDQAVVKKVNKVEYYGGRLQTVEKRNKGKSRIMAHALRQLIDQSSQVIIMGHKKPDMDSFGAALGICRFAKNRNKEVFVIINSFNETLTEMYNRAYDTGNYKFIKNEDALELVDKDTLVVIVDTHRTTLVECPELLTKTDKLVVIDHHRKTEDFIENATLTYMEAYASSTSELVTEILQYTGDKKDIDKLEAEILLAGITVDTNRFSIKTGVRTFEAASWLRRMGADTANVRQFFQTDIESIKQKAKIISNSVMPYPGVAIAVCEGKHVDVQVINSRAADEMLGIKGVKASFVLGQNEEGTTVISARSLGEMNVQTIMEKLGGGGNLSKAGAQVEISVEEAIQKIVEMIEELDHK